MPTVFLADRGESGRKLIPEEHDPDQDGQPRKPWKEAAKNREHFESIHSQEIKAAGGGDSIGHLSARRRAARRARRCDPAAVAAARKGVGTTFAHVLKV
jgi:hypothetical protein